MKQLYLLAFLLFSATALSQTRSILFLGNSYTYTNNLPDLLKQLALSAGDSIYYDSNCPGGYTLQLHSQDATTIAKIHSRQWDYVVIQAQSQEPSVDTAYVVQNVFPYAHALDSMIHANDSCTQVIFYMTWGRKFGDASNCAAYPPVCTYSGMQEQLRNRYLQMANDNHAIVAPVGAAWQNVIATNPVFDLYQADYSHPSLYGSYLAACVFYSSIYRQSPNGLNYYGGLTQSEANFLQSIASTTVMDSLSTWRTESYYPNAAFTWNNPSGNTIDCIASANGISSFQWNDGNGSGFINGTSQQSFTYPTPGFYQITLVVSNGCLNDTVTIPVTVGPLGVNGTSPEPFQLFPNPSNGNFTLQFTNSGSCYSVSITDTDGRSIRSLQKNAGTSQVEIADLSSGIYFVRIANEKELYTEKIIIQPN